MEDKITMIAHVWVVENSGPVVTWQRGPHGNVTRPIGGREVAIAKTPMLPPAEAEALCKRLEAAKSLHETYDILREV